MTPYRFYSLDEHGRVFRASVILDCYDDDEARSQGQSLIGDSPIEIWEEGRRVGTLMPEQ